MYWVTFKVSFKFNGSTKAESCRVPCSCHYEDQLSWQNIVRINQVLWISGANIMVSESFLNFQRLIISIWLSSNKKIIIIEIFLHYTQSMLWHSLGWSGVLLTSFNSLIVESCSLFSWMANSSMKLKGSWLKHFWLNVKNNRSLLIT